MNKRCIQWSSILSEIPCAKGFFLACVPEKRHYVNLKVVLLRKMNLILFQNKVLSITYFVEKGPIYYIKEKRKSWGEAV